MRAVRTQFVVSAGFAVVMLFGCNRGGPAVQIQGVNQANLAKASDVIAKTIKTKAAPSVTVEMFNGEIDVVVGDDDQVEATVTKTARGMTQPEADEALKELSIVFTEEKEGVRIVAAAPLGKAIIGGASAKLKVPAEAKVDLKTSLGAVQVKGVKGTIRAASSQGAISVKEARDALDLRTNLAGIDVDAACTNVSARNSQGHIVVRKATGALDLVTNLAKIEVDAPCSDVKAKNSQGAIIIRQATGALDLSTTLAPIEVDAACKVVSATNSQGAITVKQAKGPLRLSTTLAPILVNVDGAEVDAANSQGTITIRGAKGRIKAKSNLGGIDIHARDALVDAVNSQGIVNFSGSLAAGKHTLRTTLGNISLTLPRDAAFRIDAQATLGRIKNAFDLKQTEKSGDARLIGSVGDNPAADVHVNVSQGSVEIRKGE